MHVDKVTLLKIPRYTKMTSVFTSHLFVCQLVVWVNTCMDEGTSIQLYIAEFISLVTKLIDMNETFISDRQQAI